MSYISFKTVVRYTYKSGKLTIDEKSKVRSSFNEYGKILDKCTSICLTERNDELAKSIFIECMENRVLKAKKELDRATEQLRILREEI